MKFVFATNNAHKLEEVKALLSQIQGIEIVSLGEAGINEELPETHETLEENALEKAKYVAEKLDAYCFADDTGLFIDALDGKPGVYSARYAGEGCTSQDNVKKVLNELEGVEDRHAHFTTIIALVMDGVEYLFGGEIEGTINKTESGKDGFGYDPIFTPEGYDITFAEMNLDQKNKISHRALAFSELATFLSEVSPY